MKKLFNALAEGHDVVWIFEHDSYDKEKEFPTKDAAQWGAEEWFGDYAYETLEITRNGETADDDISLIQFYWTDDGEKEIIQEVLSTVEYEHYHGDFAEHNTYW